MGAGGVVFIIATVAKGVILKTVVGIPQNASATFCAFIRNLVQTVLAVHMISEFGPFPRG